MEMKKFSEKTYEIAESNDRSDWKFWYLIKEDKLDFWNTSAVHHAHRIFKDDIYNPYVSERAREIFTSTSGILKGNFNATILHDAVNLGAIRGMIANDMGNKYILYLSMAYGVPQSDLQKFVRTFKRAFPDVKFDVYWIIAEGFSYQPGVSRPILNTSDERKVEMFFKTGRLS